MGKKSLSSMGLDGIEENSRIGGELRRSGCGGC